MFYLFEKKGPEETWASFFFIYEDCDEISKGENAMGWFIVYLLVIGINSYILVSEDIQINNPKYWISFGCIILAYFSGQFVN